MKIKLTKAQLVRMRKQVQKNVMEHCSQAYGHDRDRETCRAAAVIGTAEFTDVLAELFKIKL